MHASAAIVRFKIITNSSKKCKIRGSFSQGISSVKQNLGKNIKRPMYLCINHVTYNYFLLRNSVHSLHIRQKSSPLSEVKHNTCSDEILSLIFI